MTKKDYDVIANGLKKAAEASSICEDLNLGVYLAYCFIADELKNENNNFKLLKFLQAIYGKSGQNLPGVKTVKGGDKNVNKSTSDNKT